MTIHLILLFNPSRRDEIVHGYLLFYRLQSLQIHLLLHSQGFDQQERDEFLPLNVSMRCFQMKAWNEFCK